MEAVLTIDSREHELIQLCHTKQVSIQTGSLPVGDMLMTLGEHTLVFERKTMADLAASIKDGRFREQKQRLTSTYPFHRITYIIESTPLVLTTRDTLYGMDTKALVSALISSRYRDGIQVIHTSTLDETLWYLQQIQQRMGEKTQLVTESKEEYTATLKVKTKKMDNITPGICYLLQLSQIPTISMTLAKDIAVKYPTLSGLFRALHEHGEKAFRDIPGMGPKRIQMCMAYLL
jgi:ERCC4-type nuclease